MSLPAYRFKDKLTLLLAKNHVCLNYFDEDGLALFKPTDLSVRARIGTPSQASAVL